MKNLDERCPWWYCYVKDQPLNDAFEITKKYLWKCRRIKIHVLYYRSIYSKRPISIDTSENQPVYRCIKSTENLTIFRKLYYPKIVFVKEWRHQCLCKNKKNCDINVYHLTIKACLIQSRLTGLNEQIVSLPFAHNSSVVTSFKKM